MIVHLQYNSGRSFRGSLMHCHLLIVQRVVMGLTPIVWIWMVCETNFLCKLNNCLLFQMHQPFWLAEYLNFKLLLLTYFQVMRVVLYEHPSFVPITPQLTNKYSSPFCYISVLGMNFVGHPFFVWSNCDFPQGDFVNAMRAAREFSSRVSSSLKVCIQPCIVTF